MTVTGTIIQAMAEVQGVSKAGTPWRKREYVIETSERYPKKLCFGVMNGNIDTMNLQQGQAYQVEFEIEGREYQGKWYHSLTAYRASKAQ